jgi:hypothetical protein
MLMGLIEDHRANLGRFLDRYLAGEFPRDMLIERKTSLEAKLPTLDKEQSQMTVQMDAQALNQAQMHDLQDFAAQVAEGLEQAEGSFEARRLVIQIMNVRACSAVEDGERVVYVRCLPGDFKVSTVNGNTCITNHNIHSDFVLTARLVLSSA